MKCLSTLVMGVLGSYLTLRLPLGVGEKNIYGVNILIHHSIIFTRYCAVCFPLTLRGMSNNWNKSMYFIVITLCATSNLPAFWQYKIDDINLGEGHTMLLIDLGTFALHSTKGKIFLWFKAVFGIFIPCALLVFCNCSMIKALRESRQMRLQCRVQNINCVIRNSNRITFMLIIIVVLFVSLVIPAEMMDFCHEIIKAKPSQTEVFMLARSVANLFQVVAFSGNFILYCILNVHFRATIKDLFTCRIGRYFQRGPRRSSSIRSSSFQLTFRTTVRRSKSNLSQINKSFRSSDEGKSNASNKLIDNNYSAQLKVPEPNNYEEPSNFVHSASDQPLFTKC